MKAFRRLPIGIFAALLSLTLLAVGQSLAGGDGILRIDSRIGHTGEFVPVKLQALDIPEPGLGAWTVNIRYDPLILSAIDCSARNNAVCSIAFAEDTVRTTGASAVGLTGTFPLATFVFQCGDNEGVSELSLGFEVFTIAVVPPAVVVPEVQNGAITCVEPSQATATAAPATATPAPALPTTGTAAGAAGDGAGWHIAALAAGGLLLTFAACFLLRGTSAWRES